MRRRASGICRSTDCQACSSRSKPFCNWSRPTASTCGASRQGRRVGMQRRGVEDDAGVRVERRELRPVGLGQADDRADLRIELGAQPLPDRRAGGEMVVVAADAARPRRLLRHQHRAGGDEAVEDDRVGAGQVDHPAEGAAGAPALAQDRRHPAEPGARGAGQLRRTRSDHADLRADRIDAAARAACRRCRASPSCRGRRAHRRARRRSARRRRAAPGSRTAAAHGSAASSGVMVAPCGAAASATSTRW